MKRVIVSGGGTGGHIFPALSIANALKRLQPDIEILFVGAEGKMEMEKVPEAGYRIEGLPAVSYTHLLHHKSTSCFRELCMFVISCYRINW